MSEVLSKDALLAELTGSLPEEIVAGCRVRALSAGDYQRLQAARMQASLDAKAEKKFEEFQVAEVVAWLSLGVVEPKLTAAEWKHALENAKADAIGELVAAVRRLTGADQAEVELAKKALKLTPDDTGS